jgi:hypothetical protein
VPASDEIIGHIVAMHLPHVASNEVTPIAYTIADIHSRSGRVMLLVLLLLLLESEGDAHVASPAACARGGPARPTRLS